MAPSHATPQAQPEPRSSFGSPLPASDSKEINPSQKTSQSGPVREEQSANLSENASTSKNITESGQSFWKDNWVWIGVGVTIVAAVAFSVFKADAVKETVTKQEFKLQMVE